MAPDRYPKRLRKEIKYYDTDGEDDQEERVEAVDRSHDKAPKKKTKLGSTYAKDKPSSKKNIFPFLSLPPELKNKIYEFTLTDPKNHYIVSQKKRSDDGPSYAQRVSANKFARLHPDRCQKNDNIAAILHPPAGKRAEVDDAWKLRSLVPQILCVNKEIYWEARNYLYSRRFLFLDPTVLYTFLAQIGPGIRPLLRDVAIAEWGYTATHKPVNSPAMTLLADATRLERLWINVCHWEAHKESFINRHNVKCPALDYSSIHYQKSMSQMIYNDCHAFFYQYGIANKRKDAALDILELPPTVGDELPYKRHKCNRTPEAMQVVKDQIRALVLARSLRIT